MKQKIGILTEQTGFTRGFCDFYPLFKWRYELKQNGYSIRFFSDHKNRKLFDQDVVCIDHRYHMFLINQYKKYPNKEFIKEFIHKLSSRDIKVVMFDSQDGAGSRDFDLIPHVNRFVKKQLLNDKIEYTIDKGYGNVRVFTGKYNLSEEEKESNRKKGEQFAACPEDQLHKLRLGWNIGMLDYREFPFSKYYPTNRFLNSIYKLPAFTDPRAQRPIDSGFRGTI